MSDRREKKLSDRNRFLFFFYDIRYIRYTTRGRVSIIRLVVLLLYGPLYVSPRNRDARNHVRWFAASPARRRRRPFGLQKRKKNLRFTI